MEEKRNTLKIVTIILAILLVLSLGYSIYDKFTNKTLPLKCPVCEEKECPTNECPSVENTTDTNKTTTTTTNSYKIFSSNMKKKITSWKLNSGYFLAKNSSWTNYADEKYDVTYKIVLTNKMDLLMIFDKSVPFVDQVDYQKKYIDKYGKIKIASNVISFAIEKYDAGGYENVYFINENGTIGVAEPYDMLNYNKSKLSVTNPLPGYKNIVSFVQGTFDGDGLTQDPYAIDINGNAFEIQGAWD